MLDHHDSRAWADHHKAFGDWTKRVASDIATSFQVLARLQYDQPWRRTRR